MRGDRDHLRQAIGNLVLNAVQHTPAATPIEVSAAIVGGEGVVVVRDHGGGLSPAALAHAFDRFWRGDSARAGTGSGLGLSIVAGIATEHGGTVTATNAPGGAPASPSASRSVATAPEGWWRDPSERRQSIGS